MRYLCRPGFPCAEALAPWEMAKRAAHNAGIVNEPASPPSARAASRSSARTKPVSLPEVSFSEDDARRYLHLGTPWVQGSMRITGVRTSGGAVYRARAVVLCAGTFMQGLLHVGTSTMPGGNG